MLVMRFTPTTEIRVRDYAMVRELWKTYKNSAEWEFIGSVVVDEPLTDSQLARLHSRVRSKIRNPDDTIHFLEGLWSLDDPRV